MAGNTFGRIFKFISFGESHGPGVGAVIEGIPAGFELDIDTIQNQLKRRRPGQSAITTARNETDNFQILSGLYEGKTLGSPLCIFIANRDQKPEDYDALTTVYRPGHADFTYDAKYGHRDPRGGGRSSARVTAGWVAAGAIAEQLLQKELPIEIAAWVCRISNIEMAGDNTQWTRKEIDQTLVRCPDKSTAAMMQTAIEKAKTEGDSLGGIITCVIRNCPAGIGEPVFDKLQARLAQAMLSINAVKGVEFGMGFDSAKMQGSAFNDIFATDENGDITTSSNHSGGIQGGISNGNDIIFRVAFRPTSTIAKNQNTVNEAGDTAVISGQGRHDPCVLPRAVPIVEAMTAATMYDLWLAHKAQK